MKINNAYLEQSVKIARLIGSGSDWVQGGGGNFSIKLDEQNMLIKASGLSLKEVDKKHGIVLVNYLKVKEYYKTFAGIKINVQIENLSNQAIFDFTRNFLPEQSLKASIETGFHAFLKKYTVHSHSVYANIINCSVDTEQLLHKIFSKTQIECVVVNYRAPGLSLAREIQKSIDSHVKKGNGWPEVLFLQNHGIVINTDNFDRCLDLYLQVDKLIKKYFKIKSIFPKVSIKKQGDCFESNTIFLKKYLNSILLNKNLFQPVIFPDQVVYLNSDVYVKDKFIQFGKKFFIDKKTKKLVYSTNEKESLTIEETIVAYCYIKENIKRFKMKLNRISSAKINFINKMESEKFRQKLLNK